MDCHMHTMVSLFLAKASLKVTHLYSSDALGEHCGPSRELFAPCKIRKIPAFAMTVTTILIESDLVCFWRKLADICSFWITFSSRAQKVDHPSWARK